MVRWFVDLLRERPEIAFFVTLTLGYALGRARIGRFSLGATPGVLIVAVLLGQLEITLPETLKQVFFLLFLFSIGYRTGPQFFRGLRKDGLSQAGLAVVFASVGVGLAYLAARMLGYDAGTAAGLVAGALTESAAVGTAGDAIGGLPLGAEDKARLVARMTTAFAVAYLVGILVPIVVLAHLGPRLLGIDLAAECLAYEETMNADRRAPHMLWRLFEVRTFRIDPGADLDGRPVAEVERLLGDARLYVDRIRREGVVHRAEPDFVVAAGDVVSILGRHEPVIEQAGRLGTEVADPGLAPGAADAVEVVLTSQRYDGVTLAELAEQPFARGVFLARLTRGGLRIPIAPGTRVERGDVLSIVGVPERTQAAIAALGVPDRVTDATDIVFVGLGIVLGATIGSLTFALGTVQIGLGAVCVLIAGLLFGWLRSVRPIFAPIPAATMWLFESLGLTGFMAVIGLAAGPNFLRGLQETGLGLMLAAALVVFAAHVVTLLAGRHVFRMHPAILFGACAGAGTATPALAAVREIARSNVPTLGYGVSCAVANVLLALAGPVMVLLLH